MKKGGKPSYKPAESALRPQLKNIEAYLSKPPTKTYPKPKGK